MDLLTRINSMERQPDPLAGDQHSTNTMVIYPEYLTLTKSNPAEAKKKRDIGKKVGLSLLYQDAIEGLSPAYTVHYNEGVGDTIEDAQRIVSKWYAGLPNFRHSISQIMKTAQQTKKTKNLFGEIFFLPDIDHHIKGIRRKALRNSINIPIQSSGSMQTKMMVEVLIAFIEKHKLNSIGANNKLK